MAYKKLNRDQHFKNPGPKRILALDGGGLKGILTLGYLARIERLLRERFGDDGFRLCDYFDLIAGTSTGAIIAAGLAKGMGVDEIVREYMTIGHDVFKSRWSRWGL
ncbi:MAG: patatin-like phospholipase family protein, partial [Geminicoccaceae bacterium]